MNGTSPTRTTKSTSLFFTVQTIRGPRRLPKQCNSQYPIRIPTLPTDYYSCLSLSCFLIYSKANSTKLCIILPVNHPKPTNSVAYITDSKKSIFITCPSCCSLSKLFAGKLVRITRQRLPPKGTAIVLENIRADFVHLIVLVVDGQQFLVAAHPEDELTNAYALLCEISYLLIL